MSTPAEIAVLGMGAMGRAVLGSLRTRLPEAHVIFYERPERVSLLQEELGIPGYDDFRELLRGQHRPDLVVECAGHQAVAELIPELLEAGVDVVLVSLGSLSDDALRARLTDAAARTGASVRLVSGAVGGLDALRSTVPAGVDSVIYEGTLWNNPLPQNPKTSWLAALSAQEAVLSQTLPLRF